ncbi:Leucyl/phenylalanyl-tRNA--protein transferase [Candidatus Phaeomarinobacter ectocarpi]|uniref:Leucyl/phenylalanyl-tRNA--protein transferase n=1 Tax=Candidatus Phaeomarinibacter ectocarpi TaxID=1458461 RepID=X5MN17_9HYPH|nr:leucyl/phenylalanyl-tRNA--protein transferase [Candidatus Phaeomarinobacter ectocarpi]CDO60905.1 Leucyl/phenylalanyl-tRNA--protein transferase [Candidatus Phaeomarinobacter ectocarpi]
MIDDDTDTDGEITADILLRAYAYGVFPMGESRDDPSLYWVDPQERGIIPLDGFKLPRKLRSTVRKSPFNVTIDTAFRAVMEACALPAPGRSGTWINDRIVDLYCELHERGYAHSVECWKGQQLVGGLYGVSLGAAYFGESMFSRETDASKIALTYLVARLRRGGFKLLDTQFVTDHLAQFGALEIPRDEYRRRLAEAITLPSDFYSLDAGAAADEIVQSVSHTS